MKRKCIKTIFVLALAVAGWIWSGDFRPPSGDLVATAEAIIVDHVELEQDIVLCLGNALEYAVKCRLAIDKQIDAVTAGKLHVRKFYHGSVPGRPFSRRDFPRIQIFLDFGQQAFELVLFILEGICHPFELTAAQHQVCRDSNEGKCHQRN